MSERRRGLLFGGLIVVLAAFVVGAVVTADSPSVDRAEAIGSRIRCPVCQGESIAESPSQLARDMMALVRSRIDQGAADSQIIDEILSSYSEAQLLDPPIGPSTLALWLIPSLALVAGVWMLVGRRRPERGGDGALDPAEAKRDLEELEGQIASGEIDEATGDRLRETYRSELAVAERSRPADVSPPAPAPAGRRSHVRVAVGATVVIVGVGLAVGLVGQFVQARDEGAFQGVAAPDDEFDPSAYSNETLEAVIASYAEDPAVADQLRFMRFRLAERYFESGEYRNAFTHYQAIIESDPPADLASAVYTRLAWIVWVGNQEVDLAVSLADRAIESDPGNTEARYVKAQLVWCGLERPADAVPLLEDVLADGGLDPAVVSQVEDDLVAARGGETCRP